MSALDYCKTSYQPKLTFGEDGLFDKVCEALRSLTPEQAEAVSVVLTFGENYGRNRSACGIPENRENAERYADDYRHYEWHLREAIRNKR
jgi:hypothetical protein